MTKVLDEESAWRLVLALSRRSAAGSGAGESVRAEEAASEGSLQVHPDGGWTAAPDPTPAVRDLFDLYLPLALRPDLVIGQLGQSIDGRIATETGDSYYVTGPEDILRLHRLRALVDAVVVGAGTVDRDDPRLTVRRAEGSHPVRVVLDPEGRLRPDHKLFVDGEAETIVVRRVPAGEEGDQGAHASGRRATRSGGAETLWLQAAGAEGFDPAEVLRALRDRGLRRILVEGGGITVSRFLGAGVLDRLHVAVAPLLIGSGRPALTLPPIASLAEALRPRCRHFKLGDDLLFDVDLRQGD